MKNRCLTNGDLESGRAGRDVQTDTVRGLHAGEVGVGALTASLDSRAGAVATADLQGGDGHASGSGNEAGGVSAAPVVVLAVAIVPLDPGVGVLADTGGRDAAGTTRGTALRIVVGSDDLAATGGEVEAQSLVVLPEAVEAATGANLVPDDTLLVLARVVLKGGGILVAAGAVNQHVVAAVIAGDADVADVSNICQRGALGLAAAERLDAGRAGSGAAGRAGSRGRLGLRGSRSRLGGGGLGRRRRRRRCAGRSGSLDLDLNRRRRSRLLGNDEVEALLERAVDVSVAVVAARVSSDAQRGG